MKFEYDLRKSESNRAKHGLDFDEAQKLWDGDFVDIPVRISSGESRRLVIGEIGNDCWSAVVTMRGDATRIISVRRSRNEEKNIYKRHFG